MFEGYATKLDAALKSYKANGGKPLTPPVDDCLVGLISNFTKYNSFVKGEFTESAIQSLNRMQTNYLPKIKNFFQDNTLGTDVLMILTQIEGDIKTTQEGLTKLDNEKKPSRLSPT